MLKSEEYISLIQKYNVPCPRYTSYPTVPYWDNSTFSIQAWKDSVRKTFVENGSEEGISLYIHLPYCESLCTYCGCNTRITVNHAVELPYIETVLKEWNLYKELFGKTPTIKELHLGGGTPTFFSSENLALLIKGILFDTVVSKEAEFSFEGHPGNTTEDHLRVLYDLGFRRVSFGIQDFDPVVQDVIHRKQSFEEVEYVTNKAREIGYTSVNFDLVYGLPMQTLATVIDTIEKVNSLKPDRIAFYSYAHVPWIKPGQRKFTEADLPDNETKRTLYETGRSMFERAGYLEIGMDHFSLPADALYRSMINKTLHRNFMGYTPCHTSMLIGLGCSSISDSGLVFAQNKKTVEEYMECIQKGELAVFHGHVLTDEDQILRTHILNLICNLETSWENEKLRCSALYQSLINLSEMEEEGLVMIANCSLKVTEKGKAFIRNICAVFDARLHRKNSVSPIFSKSV